MQTTSSSLSELHDELLDLLRRYKEASQDERTPLTRQLANLLVDAREHFQTAEGEPDWKGYSYAYRQWVSDLYSDAKIDRKERPTVQAAVRYHAGSVLRDRLPDDELLKLGLMKQTPRTRSAERRNNRMALLNAISHRELPQGSLLALHAAYTMLNNVDAEEIKAMPETDRRMIEATLEQMERRVWALRRDLASAE